MTPSSRALLGMLGAVALCCEKPKSRREPDELGSPPPVVSAKRENPDAASWGVREMTYHYDKGPFGPADVVVAVPVTKDQDVRFPVLVTFHGRGESLKGPARGARGWIDDYGLRTAVRRLETPPLTADDLLGFVTAERLESMNRALAAASFKGLIVVCPYLADALHDGRALDDGRRLGSFIADEVLPRVYRETPAVGTASTTGMDGVSLGGRAALFAGLSHPEAFGVVAALQPAIDESEAGVLGDLAKSARLENPRLVLRLLTSTDDYFLDATRALSKSLDERGVAHRFDEVVGPHSYEFNRGPGVYEMLLFHDRALRGAEAP